MATFVGVTFWRRAYYESGLWGEAACLPVILVRAQTAVALLPVALLLARRLADEGRRASGDA